MDLDFLNKRTKFNSKVVCIFFITKTLLALKVILKRDEFYEIKTFLDSKNEDKKWSFLISCSFKVIENETSIEDLGLCTYDTIYDYLMSNFESKEDISNNDIFNSEHINLSWSISLIITQINQLFQTNICLSVFTNSSFINNELSECAYEIFVRFKDEFPKQSFIFLERAANLNNFKANFELGIIKINEGNYYSSLNYFRKCTDISPLDYIDSSNVFEITYIPSLYMIGIMLKKGWYYSLNIEEGNQICQYCISFNDSLSKRHGVHNYLGFDFTRARLYDTPS